MAKFRIGIYEDQEAVEENNLKNLPGEVDLDEALGYLEDTGYGGVITESGTGRSFIVDPQQSENRWIVKLFS